MRGSVDRGHSRLTVRLVLHATGNTTVRGNTRRRKARDRG
jgi:hypothetical protein